MKRVAGSLVFSPTDLTRFLESPFASWMDRRYLEDPASLVPDADDPQMVVLARRGNEHEARFLQRLLDEGRDVAQLTRTDGVDATLAALRAGREVIFQPRLAANGFEGFADFLVRDDANGGYAVWDTKLSRHVKPYHLVQLCCYADMLEAMTGTRPALLAVVLGDGRIETFATGTCRYYYRRLQRRFLELMARFPDGEPPLPDPSGDHGRWSSHAARILAERDHLSLVAGITRGQIARLEAAGVENITRLATAQEQSIPGLAPDVFARLREQAALQVESRGAERPRYRILPPLAENPRAGLAALPPASPKDVFFDMEGYPGANGYLEYLFGAVTFEAGREQFHDWWAHDPVAEKQAFESFMDWAYARWLEDPAMHVYHYAAYEPAALKRLMGQYGTREHHVDEFLRHCVFVDLYDIVRRGVRIGEPRYSIKNVERLYMQRSGEVTDAGASIGFYDRWVETGEPADWRASPLLGAIRRYNEDDCVSTRRLADWLRAQQAAAGITYLEAKGEEEAPEAKPPDERTAARRALVDALLAEIPADVDQSAAEAEPWRIQSLVAWLVDFHRREHKPEWWRFFDRQSRSTDELRDDLDCLAGLELAGEPAPVKQSQHFRYRFDAEQETKLKVGDRVYFVPDTGVSAKIEALDPAGAVVLSIGNRALAGVEGGALPAMTSVIPQSQVTTRVLEASIERLARAWMTTRTLPPALMDFLVRSRPRFRVGAPTGPLVLPGEALVDAAIRLAADLDQSCLCIQGPPGTGKTFTAARVIASLLAEGKRIGICSNSHKAIDNLAAAVARVSGGSARMLRVGGDADDELYESHPSIQRVASADGAASAYEGGLIAGTAWLFARGEFEKSLDYLFIDEAGQVSVANLVAASPSAANLVLMGDQTQLAQPTQGSHPGESGFSVLEYYLQHHATVPPERGLFLEQTHRLHPAICDLRSEVVYEGRLRSAPGTERRVIEVPADAEAIRQEAGILFVPVEHEGNSQASDEEAEAVVRLTGQLLGRRIGGDPDPGRRVSVGDILYVAPYNLQVRKLAERLPAGARVGSVDRFQGQEAPIVIVSLCASPGEFGPRGMEFVLDLNRLNVAISRAQSLVIVVGDPRLADTVASSPANVARLNLMARLASLRE